ncbi:MAG: sodium:calcium antiporter [Acidimicrobiales bacterium]|nr:sodium:calcium antiporter [Acidimicrobiales bacterium]
MSTATAAAVVLVGFGLLGVASDRLVIGAARSAELLRVPPVIIGAVVIGFGTSAPEMLVTGLASLEGAADLAVGNLIGSNLANLLLVFGTAAAVAPISVSSGVIRREVPVSLGAVCLFAACLAIGLPPWTGAVLLLGLVAALSSAVREARRFRRSQDSELLAEVHEIEARGPATLANALLVAVAGLVGTITGAHLVVTGTTELAAIFGLREGLIGLSLVAVGTSLPELASSVQAARRGDDELIVGNVLGSNLFNSLAGGTVVGFTTGDRVIAGSLETPAAAMVAVALIATVVMTRMRRIPRSVGVVALFTYLLLVPVLITT